MKIELKNFFKYYDEKLIHHREAISQLEEALEKLAPELLDDSSDWVNTYRNKPKPEPKPAAILPVPYYPQTDNYTQPERTCNSSACAMALEYFRPGTLRGPKGDDAYIREVFALGDTTDPWVQTKVLAEYGVKSEYFYNLCFADLDRELENKRPVVIGILHRGPLDAPTGGHVVVVIGKNSKGSYIIHDPYGDLYDGYTSNVYNGKQVTYEKYVLESRWTVEGPMSGWGRKFSAKVEEKTSEIGKLPAAGVELVKEFEGLHQKGSDDMIHAYPDPLSGGLPYTIGYGSTKDIDGSPFELGDKITVEKADLLLAQQLKYNYLSTLERTIPYWDIMNDNQHGALLSFAYNLGANFYGSSDFSTISRVLREKEWSKCPMHYTCIVTQAPLSKRAWLEDVSLKEISGMLDSIFHDWFEGRWSNQRQAYNNPRGQSFVHILHEFDGINFSCTYRYARQRSAYRYFTAALHHDDGHVILKNPVHDLRFKVQNGCFTSSDEFVSRGIRYVNEAYLGPTWYHVKDQGFDVKTGKQLWGLEGDEFYEFSPHDSLKSVQLFGARDWIC